MLKIRLKVTNGKAHSAVQRGGQGKLTIFGEVVQTYGNHRWQHL